jgi:hypothetical protein
VQGCVIQFVDLAEEVESIHRRQVIPELRALTEDGADLEGEGLTLLPGNIAQYGGLAAAGMENAGQDLDCGRFSGAVGADEAQQFPFLHHEGESAHRLNRLKRGPPQRAQAAAQTGGLALRLKGLPQIAYRDGGHRRESCSERNCTP